MGLGLFKALFCCTTKSQDIPIISSSPDSSPKHNSYGHIQPTNSSSYTNNSKIGPILGKPYVVINQIYEMKKELGRGQSGVTYLCVEKITGREYACKSIARSKLLSEQEIDDVKREVMILQHLSGQPNIVEFRGAYEDKQNVYLVMELCKGGELFDTIIAKGNYTESEAASIMRQIVNVVHVCHFMGVIHRDLKPENFLLASRLPNSALKATDFGLSIFLEEGTHLLPIQYYFHLYPNTFIQIIIIIYLRRMINTFFFIIRVVSQTSLDRPKHFI